MLNCYILAYILYYIIKQREESLAKSTLFYLYKESYFEIIEFANTGSKAETF